MLLRVMKMPVVLTGDVTRVIARNVSHVGAESVLQPYFQTSVGKHGFAQKHFGQHMGVVGGHGRGSGWFSAAAND
jgi:hypothetical protein